MYNNTFEAPPPYSQHDTRQRWPTAGNQDAYSQPKPQQQPANYNQFAGSHPPPGARYFQAPASSAYQPAIQQPYTSTYAPPPHLPHVSYPGTYQPVSTPPVFAPAGHSYPQHQPSLPSSTSTPLPTELHLQTWNNTSDMFITAPHHQHPLYTISRPPSSQPPELIFFSPGPTSTTAPPPLGAITKISSTVTLLLHTYPSVLKPSSSLSSKTYDLRSRNTLSTISWNIRAKGNTQQICLVGSCTPGGGGGRKVEMAWIRVMRWDAKRGYEAKMELKEGVLQRKEQMDEIVVTGVAMMEVLAKKRKADKIELIAGVGEATAAILGS